MTFTPLLLYDLNELKTGLQRFKQRKTSLKRKVQHQKNMEKMTNGIVRFL